MKQRRVGAAAGNDYSHIHNHHRQTRKQQRMTRIERALISVSDKTGVVEFARALSERGVEILSTGGTARLLREHGITVVDVADHSRVLDEMRAGDGAVSAATRFQLAVKVFEHTARYDGAIANYLGTIQSNGDRARFPQSYTSQFIKVQDLRYGENPHQAAAFYVEHAPAEASVATAQQLQGKELSFTKIAATDAALECVKEFSDTPACVIVKHANPCGVAAGATLPEAYERAYQTAPTSAFGGIIAFNQSVDARTAQAIVERQFVEVIIAPSFAADALAVLAAKKNVRVLRCGACGAARAAGR